MSDKIEATLTGKVKEVFSSANGPALVIELQRENAKYPDKVTVWGVKTTHEVGQAVIVAGVLSWGSKTGTNGKRYFNVNINEPTVNNIGDDLL